MLELFKKSQNQRIVYCAEGDGWYGLRRQVSFTGGYSGLHHEPGTAAAASGKG